MATTDLHLDAIGGGERAFFVHGSFGWGLDTFPQQRALADSHQVVLVDRRGYGRSLDVEILGGTTICRTSLASSWTDAHLVGQSYGAVRELWRHAELEKPIKTSGLSKSSWTRTQGIRTAGEIVIKAVVVGAVAEPVCQRISPKARHLRELGMSEQSRACLASATRPSQEPSRS